MQLSPLESQRVQCILTDTVECLTFLGALTPDILAQKDELSLTVGVEISRVIEEQKKLEKRYEELVLQRSQLRLTNKSKYKEKQAEIEEVARELRYATKMLCRNLQDNPNVGENLLKMEKERINLIDLLQKTYEELDNNTFQSLIVAVEVERAKTETVKLTVQKEKEASLEVQKLKDDVADELSEKEREKNSENEQILSLKDDLQELKAKTAIDTKYMRKEAKARSICAKRLLQTEEASLSEKINNEQKSTDIETRVNKESVVFLEAKHTALQDEIQNWINKYDHDIEEKRKGNRNT